MTVSVGLLQIPFGDNGIFLRKGGRREDLFFDFENEFSSVRRIALHDEFPGLKGRDNNMLNCIKYIKETGMLVYPVI